MLPENNATDNIISNINTTGKFSVVDTETNEVLMDNHHIKQVKVLYGSSNSTTSNGTSVGLDIEFNKEGTKKLEEISNQYVKTEGNTTEEGTDTTTEKTVTMKIDEQEIMKTSFEQPIKVGRLQLSIGSSTNDAETLQGYIGQASSIANVLNTGSIPIKYDLEENQYVLSDITEDNMQIAVYVILGILVIALVVLIIRYQLIGTLGIISYIGFVSLFILIIRYTNVVVSIEGFLGMIVILILNYIFINRLLAKVEAKKEVYQQFFTTIIPIVILVITFCFTTLTPISSFGMVMFWGIILIAVYNSIVTNSLLKINAGKEQ